MNIIRRSYRHLNDLISDFPGVTAVFNCTGLGARHLGGVKDENVHPKKVCRKLRYIEHQDLVREIKNANCT